MRRIFLAIGVFTVVEAVALSAVVAAGALDPDVQVAPMAGMVVVGGVVAVVAYAWRG